MALLMDAFAANHFVRTAAVGTGSGADWTNACTDFTGSCAVGSLVRGDTYYVATGTYAAETFNRADSGSLVITIKGATSADHGIATGWLDSFSVSTSDGGAQAIWSGAITFTTDFWVWDGSVGAATTVNPPDTTPSHYGFRLADHLDNGILIGTAGSGGVCGSANHDITVGHVYSLAATGDTAQPKEFEDGNPIGGVLTNIHFHHFLVDGWQGFLRTRSGNCSGTPYSGWVVEQGLMLNGYSSASNHGEWVDPDERDISGLILRYLIVKGHSGTAGMTGCFVANNSNNTSMFLYGSVIDGVQVGNGCVTGSSQGNMVSATVYNTDFINFTSDSGDWVNGPGSANVVQNSILFNMGANQSGVGAGWTNDWNAYFSVTGAPTETHRQTGSSNPFVNSVGLNYQLLTDTTAGNIIAANIPAGCTEGVNCVDTDALGVQRGANGTWDRGALQIAGGNPQAATPSFSPSAGTYVGSQSVTITSSSGGAIICYNTTGSPVTNGTTGCTTGTLYSGPVAVSVNSTLFAVAGGTGFTDSTVASANYNFTIPPQNGVGSSLSAISH